MSYYQGAEYFYKGSPSSLEPTYGDLFSGYRFPFSRLGSATSIQTANQVDEVSKRMMEGLKTIEVQTIQQEKLEAIPKQQMKEITQLAKLTGAEITFHAPMIDPAGFQREGEWSEQSRKRAEEDIFSSIKRAEEFIKAHKENMPVTIHASSVPAREWKVEEGKPKEIMLVAINQETGELIGIKEEKKVYPAEKEKYYTPEQQIKVRNNSEWYSYLSNIVFYKKEGDEIMEKIQQLGSLANAPESKLSQMDLSKEKIEQKIGELGSKFEVFKENVEMALFSAYNKAYKYGDEETKRKLEELSKEWKEKVIKAQSLAASNPQEAMQIENQILDNAIDKLQKIKPPEIYKKIEDFSQDKASETISNVAYRAFKEFQEKAPIISLENWQAGTAFSSAEKLKELIEESRKKLAYKLIEEGMSEKEANKQVEKLIGATWDIGHINQLRKYGFKEEEIIKETEKIAPYVKHVHLTDNFGHTDSHLPPGMGNVPIKEIMKKLEEAEFKGRAIVEAGGFVAEFKTSPTSYIAEFFGSPMFFSTPTPYWNTWVGTPGNYFAGYGMFPEQHTSIYGSGFSSLPTSFGGEVHGSKSRFSNTPIS